MGRRSNRSGTLYKRGAVWYVKIPVGGRFVRQSTGTGDKAKARAILDGMARGSDLTDAERLAAIEARLRPETPDPELSDVWDRYTQHPENVSQSDMARTQDHGRWAYFMRWVSKNRPSARTIEDVTDGVAVDFIMELRTNTAPKTINDYVRVLRRIWRLNGCAANPWMQFKWIKHTPHLRRALSDAEVTKLISRADGELKILFALGAFTGLRMSDCARARWESFDDGTETMTVTPSKTRHSSGRAVAIPVHPSLQKLIGTRAGRSGYLMPGLASLYEQKLSRRVMRHFADCGFECCEKVEGFRQRVTVVGFHSLRSTFITNMANIGAPMAMVQAIVGHMTPEMSMRYYRANAEAARGRIAALPAFGIV